MDTLVINGSPKGERSNTMRLVRAFLDGAGQNGAEIRNVADMRIESCLGCLSCWNKTPGVCVIRDEMSGLLPRIIAADLIVWAFPLYYFSVPGKLKNLIDLFPHGNARGGLYGTDQFRLPRAHGRFYGVVSRLVSGALGEGIASKGLLTGRPEHRRLFGEGMVLQSAQRILACPPLNFS